MTRRADISQWRDHTEEPVIVWTYTGVCELLPVAVDDSHESDLYAEYASAFYAANAYQTFDEVCEEYAGTFTPEQISNLYSAGDGSAEAAGLPAMWVVESTGDGDQIIYVDEVTMYNTRRATLEEATPYMYPDDLEEIRELIAAARAEYDV